MPKHPSDMKFPLKRTKLTLPQLNTAQKLVNSKPIGNLNFDEFCLVEQTLYEARNSLILAISHPLRLPLMRCTQIRDEFDYKWDIACSNLDFKLTGLCPAGYLKPQ